MKVLGISSYKYKHLYHSSIFPLIEAKLNVICMTLIPIFIVCSLSICFIYFVKSYFIASTACFAELLSLNSYNLADMEEDFCTRNHSGLRAGVVQCRAHQFCIQTVVVPLTQFGNLTPLNHLFPHL